MNNTSSMPGRPEMVTWYWTARVVMSIIAFLGNVLVILIILSSRRLRVRPSNWYICTLAVADMLVGVVITPCEYLCMYSRSCNLAAMRLAFDVIVHFSVTSLCAMTFDRYIAISRPLTYRQYMTKRRVTMVILSSWFLGLVLPLAGYISMEHGHTVISYKTIRILNTLLLQILPPIILAIVFIVMIYIAKQHENKEREHIIQVHYNYANEVHIERAKGRASVRMMGVVILVFIVCYMLAMYRSFYYYVMNKNIPMAVTYISRLMILVNSAVNFLVYAFLKQDFREEFRRIFKVYCARQYQISSKHTLYGNSDGSEMRMNAKVQERRQPGTQALP